MTKLTEQKYAERMVIANVTYLIEELLGHDPEIIDDRAINLTTTTCPHCGEPFNADDHYSGETDEGEPLPDDFEYQCEVCGQMFMEDEIEEEFAEIMEWLIVDESMIRELKAQGEVVLDNRYWGRRCTGQQPYMDDVIKRIVANINERMEQQY